MDKNQEIKGNFIHIYRELNVKADDLSKQALSLNLSNWKRRKQACCFQLFSDPYMFSLSVDESIQMVKVSALKCLHKFLK
jgi:hypothetical protein